MLSYENSVLKKRGEMVSKLGVVCGNMKTMMSMIYAPRQIRIEAPERDAKNRSVMLPASQHYDFGTPDCCRNHWDAAGITALWDSELNSEDEAADVVATGWLYVMLTESQHLEQRIQPGGWRSGRMAVSRSFWRITESQLDPPWNPLLGL